MGPIINVSNSSSTYSALPELAQVSGPKSNATTLYVIWLEGRGLFDNSAQTSGAGHLSQNKSLSIVYKTSNDNGTTFGKPVTLYNYTGNSIFGLPTMIYGGASPNGSRTYLTWADNSTNNNFNVYFSRTSANGTRFEDPIKIADSTIPDTTSQNSTVLFHYPGLANRLHQIVYPQIATTPDGKRIQVLWTETLSVLTKAPAIPPPLNQSSPKVGNESMVSTTLSTSLLRPNSSGTAPAPGASTNTGPPISYRDMLPQFDIQKRVFLSTSNNSGASFGKPQMILNSTEKSTSMFLPEQPATLTVAGNNVYIIASKAAFGETLEDRSLLLFISRDGGKTFKEKPISLAITSNDAAKVPISAGLVAPRNSVNGSGNNLLYMLVTMAENKTKSIIEKQGGKIYPGVPPFFDLSYSQVFVKSNDSGSTFGRPIEIVNDTRSLSGASIATSGNGNNVYVSWVDPGIDVIALLQSSIGSGKYLSQDEINKLNTAGSTLIRASIDQGNTFGSIVRLNDSKPIEGNSISFGGDAGGLLVPDGDSGLYVIKTRITYHEPPERILPSSEILIWASNNAGSSFAGPIKISNNNPGISQFGPIDGLGINNGGLEPVLLTPTAIYVAWSGQEQSNSDFGSLQGNYYYDVLIRELSKAD